MQRKGFYMSFEGLLTKESNVLTAKLAGEFDTDAASEFQKQLEEYDVNGIDKIVFDLSDVTFVASSGIRVFIVAKKRLITDMDVEVIGAKGIVLSIIQMSGVNSFINVVE